MTSKATIASDIRNHPGVKECELSADSDYKYEVFLKAGWTYSRGRLAGNRTGFFHSNKDFRYAKPVATWATVDYPGGPARIEMFRKGDELGDIRIQDYSIGSKHKESYRVGSFLPGNTVCNPGDTPKTEPECYARVTDKRSAAKVFARYVREAIANGWTTYEGDSHAQDQDDSRSRPDVLRR